MIETSALIINAQMQNRTRIYTVSQVNSLIKGILGSNLPRQMTVSGEISGWKGAHSSGICYFSLKDEGAVLPCVMWPDKFAKVKFRPENGLAIFGTGYISVYELQGKYQFYIESMEPAGKGALWLAYEQTKNRLAEEGLFDKAHKKPLPKYPKRIGILTSESGAAVRDIEKSIFDRWSCVLCLYPVPVQGEGAAEKIAAALRDVNKRNRELKLDILIVGRGGGSLEDLWAFNEEILARAIFDSKIPVISAVGHEIDTTIADLVADARASTPTKAGVTAVPDMQEVLGQLASMETRLQGETKAKLKLAQQSLETVLASAVFRNPLLPVRDREQQLDDLRTAITDSIRGLLAQALRKLTESHEQVRKIEPYRLLRGNIVSLQTLEHRVEMAMQSILNKATQSFNDKAASLKNAIAGLLANTRQRLQFNREEIARIRPEGILRKKSLELSSATAKASAAMKAVVGRLQMQVIARENKLAGLNPKSVLQRGYSITTNKKTGLLIRNLEDVQITDYIITELAQENLIESKVTKKQNRNK